MNSVLSGASQEPAPRDTNGNTSRLRLPTQIYYVHSFSTTALLILASLYTLYLTRDVCVPLALAFVLYLVLSPILRLIERLHVPTTLASAVIVIGLLGALGFGAYTLSGPVVEWVTRAPLVAEQVSRKLQVVRRPVEQVQQASEEVEKMTDVGSDQQRQVVLKEGNLASRVFGNATELSIQISLIAVLLYFLLATGQIFREKLVRIMPTFGDKKKAVTITNEIQRQVSRYLLTITLINSGLGFAVGAALWLLGMPSPLLWGVMAAVLNFIPYLGSLAGITIVGIVALITFDTLYDALLPPVIYLALTSLEGQIITPSILGRSLTLNPLVIFLVVVVWGWVWGIPGALLAVPMLVVFKVMCDNIEAWAPVGEFLSGKRP